MARPLCITFSSFLFFILPIQPSKQMGAFQYNPLNGWVNFKFTHWHLVAWGNNKYKNIFGI